MNIKSTIIQTPLMQLDDPSEKGVSSLSKNRWRGWKKSMRMGEEKIVTDTFKILCLTLKTKINSG